MQESIGKHYYWPIGKSSRTLKNIDNTMYLWYYKDSDRDKGGTIYD